MQMDLQPLTRPADSASAFCLHHGLEVYLKDAAQLFAVDTHAAPPPSVISNSQHSCRFMAHYLTAVTCGRQVLWRHYSFVSGTNWNRKCFLAAAQRALPAGPEQRLSFADTLSLLQLLCPDFPATVVKNAWSSAVSIQEWVDFQKSKQQQQQEEEEDLQQPAQQPTAAADRVQLPVFWQCLEVTFIYEHCLLFIRREAFDQNKRCGSLQGLEASMQCAVSLMPQNGWPVLPERCWKMAVGQASRAATYPDFAFGDLVRALCCCRELVRGVRRELQETAAAADAASTALLSLPGSRPCSSTDKQAGSSLA